MEDRFEIELVNDYTEFDAISAEAAECKSDVCSSQVCDYVDDCSETDFCVVDYG